MALRAQQVRREKPELLVYRAQQVRAVLRALVEPEQLALPAILAQQAWAVLAAPQDREVCKAQPALTAQPALRV